MAAARRKPAKAQTPERKVANDIPARTPAPKAPAKKAAATPKAAPPVKGGITTREEDPQSWLFLNPDEEARADDYVYGVLRKNYADRVNSAEEFGRRKLRPVSNTDEPLWERTAERADVVLPPGVDDTYRDPRSLLAAVDAGAIDSEQALLTYVTLTFPDADRLHGDWERARAFAYQVLARERQLATLCIQHAPHRAGSPNPPHVHLLIVPRKLSGLGLGAYDLEFCRDQGQRVIHKLWMAFRAGW